MQGHLDYQLIKSVSERTAGRFSITFTASGVSMDSNEIGEGDLYVPVIGDRYDGHHFIEAAIEAGASGTFWKEGKELPGTVPDSFPVFYVKDPAEALRKLASAYLTEIDPVTIAVTGDYTRTAAKQMLRKVLAKVYNIHSSDRITGDENTVIKTILSMPPETDAVICDVNPFGEDAVESISRLLKPSFSLISSSPRAVESRELMYAAAIENGMKASSSLMYDQRISLLDEREWKTDTITYGDAADSLFKVRKADIDIETRICTYQLEGIMMDFQVPLLMSSHLNTTAAVTGLALQLGLGAEHIYSALADLTTKDLLLDNRDAWSGSVVLFDHGNMEETSLAYSAGMLKDLYSFNHRVLIVDEGFQAAPEDKTLHEVFASFVESPITDVITVGEKAFWVTESLKRRGTDTINSRHFPTHHDAVETFSSLIEEGSIILYRGANRLLLEQIIDELNRR